MSPPRTGSTILMSCLNQLLESHTLISKVWSSCESTEELNIVCNNIYNTYNNKNKKFIAVTNPVTLEDIKKQQNSHNFFDLPIDYITIQRSDQFKVALSLALCKTTNIWHEPQEKQRSCYVTVNKNVFSKIIPQVNTFFNLQQKQIYNDKMFKYCFDYNDIESRTDTEVLHYIAEQLSIVVDKDIEYIYSCTKSTQSSKDKIANYNELVSLFKSYRKENYEFTSY